MAYTKAPMQDTYQTKQIPLVYAWDNRVASLDGSLDTQQTIAQNVYFDFVNNQETGDQYYNVHKRDGIIQHHAEINDNILGMYYWEKYSVLVFVTVTGISRIQVSGTVSTTATTDFSSAFVKGVNFTEFLYENGSVDLVISSEEVLGVLNAGGAWTKITDADLPVSMFAYPVFLDGYLFILSQDGTIHNSDLNSPTVWQASNFIAVESYPDVTQAIARVGNYIAALGTTSTEWFYDAGNPTGTPLARVDGATQQVGYLQGLVGSDNSVYFVGRSNLGTPSVYKITGLKLIEIGTATLRRWLGTTSYLSSSRGHIFSMGGHRFYVIVQNRNVTTPIQTYMLDLDNKMESSLILRNDTQSPFVFTSATGLRINTGATSETVETYFTEYNSKVIWKFSSTSYQDQQENTSFVNYTCTFETRPLDFGNYRLKFVSRLVFGTDQTSSSSLMNVAWSDNDQRTFTASRTFDVSNVYTPLWQCGSFRKRSFQITYADNFPMRWRSVEIDYNQGQA